mmetsp:Transcript_55527/g.109623  ORF Transcript_55527/g.109623 Transcript_55527/m.109623 type:complete len:176 (+) Transcript_55527:331-858(+)
MRPVPATARQREGGVDDGSRSVASRSQVSGARRRSGKSTRGKDDEDRMSEIQQQAMAEAARHNKRMEEFKAQEMQAVTETARHNKRMEDLKEREMEAMTEAACWHNKRMEDLKERELEREERELEHKQQMSNVTLQQMELQYKMLQIEAYKNTKDTISPEVIRREFPELARFVTD